MAVFRFVNKSNINTPMLGALGYVDDNAVRIYRLTARAMKAGRVDWATPFDLTKISKDDLPKVEIVYNYQEAGGGAIRALVEDGAKGIVTAGTGAGGISSKMGAARTAANKDHGVVFVSTTRTGSGSIDGGSEGIIAGDNLNPQHARMMLLLSLAFTDDFNTIKYWFETVGTQNVVVPNATGAFSDEEGHWAAEAIKQGAAAGIVNGYDDDTFKPDNTVSRAEFSVMLIQALGIRNVGAPLDFADKMSIPPWAGGALAQAVKAGIISGYSDGTFRPDAPVLRAEIASMLVKSLGLTTEGEPATGYADDSAIPQWAKGAVKALKDRSVIQGNENNEFAPNAAATRAEAMTLIMNLLKAKAS